MYKTFIYNVQNFYLQQSQNKLINRVIVNKLILKENSVTRLINKTNLPSIIKSQHFQSKAYLIIGLQLMGNLSLGSIVKNYDFYQIHSVWQQWQIATEIPSIRLSKVIKHKRNPSILGQLHQTMHVNDFENHLMILQFRKTYYQSTIVGVFGVYSPNPQQKTNFPLCGQPQDYYLVTQHMPFCYSDIGIFELAHGIHILKRVLSGAKLIKEKLGIITLYDENMIFFDNQNKCKTWINQDTSLNHCVENNESVSQEESVLSIFSTVQVKIKHSQNFQNYLRKKESVQLNTFAQAIDFVHKFRSQVLKLTFSGKKSHCEGFGELTLRDHSQAKTSNVKKSLSTKKRTIKNTQNQKLGRIKSLISKEHKNIDFSNFITQEVIKKSELKKQKIEKAQVIQKFFSPSSRNAKNRQKTLSLTSSNQESVENEKSTNDSMIYPNHKVQKKLQFSIRQNMNMLEPRQTIASVHLQKAFRNILKNNQKLSLSQYRARLKKNAPPPYYQETRNFQID